MSDIAIARPAAGTKVTVTVTAGHIARATPCTAGHCPIALAIYDALPGAEGVGVWPPEPPEYRAYAHVWTGPSSWLKLRLGHDALTFMRHFDDGTGVGPATFEAEVA